MIAKSLVRERLRTGLSLAEIARRAGIAKSTLSQLEAGNGNPSIETLWSLCVALDILCPSAGAAGRQNTGHSPWRRHEGGCRTGPLPGDAARDLPAGRAA
jgi:DNA-binding XRE family transcriptional regulator